MTDFTPGSRWLLPVSLLAKDWLSIPCKSGSLQFKYNMLELNEIAIPADRITELEAEVARYKGIDARLSDNKALEDFVYHIFYTNPIENARANLVVAIQRYLRGEPLVTEDEAQRAELDAMSPEDRAAWWRKRNAEKLNAHD